MKNLSRAALYDTLKFFLQEDDLLRNASYLADLPSDPVRCQLKIKSPLVLAGLPFLEAVFAYLHPPFKLNAEIMEENEGKWFDGIDEINFNLPFAVALTGERLALNLVQKCSSIATYTKKFVDVASPQGITILDTRKTTPGLRFLEKYGVKKGGGSNHRFGQNDVWMVKDNHKKFFGGLTSAVHFFRDQKAFYQPLIVEIHDLEELKEAVELRVKHVMLDNFKPEMTNEAVSIKPDDMTFEVSGGIRFGNFEDYMIKGVDAISLGVLTYGAPPVDLSLKYARA
jgi:nicotinate-nucleotide pyrophosphorylase (carboxylating)